MTLPQARAILPRLSARGRDRESERAAQEALLEVADSFSPRVEDGGEGVVVSRPRRHSGSGTFSSRQSLRDRRLRVFKTRADARRGDSPSAASPPTSSPPSKRPACPPARGSPPPSSRRASLRACPIRPASCRREEAAQFLAPLPLSRTLPGNRDRRDARAVGPALDRGLREAAAGRGREPSRRARARSSTPRRAVSIRARSSRACRRCRFPRGWTSSGRSWRSSRSSSSATRRWSGSRAGSTGRGSPAGGWSWP